MADTDPQATRLLERQRESEDNSRTQGALRFKRRAAEASAADKGSTVGGGIKLLQLAVDPLEAGLLSLIEESEHTRGPKHIALKWVKLIGADVAAYMTARVVLDKAIPIFSTSEDQYDTDSERDDAEREVAERVSANGCKRLRLADAALEISALILDELHYRRLQEKAPGLFQYRMEKFTTSSYAHMARSLNAAMKYADVDVSDLAMTYNQKIQVGAKLIDLLVTTTSIATIERSVERASGATGVAYKNQVFLSLTPETISWLSQRNDALEFLSPMLRPMVVRPLPWKHDERGGYLYALRNKIPLVNRASVEHRKTIEATPLSVVYDALNRIQNTAWKINTDVLELVEAIQRKGSAMAGVPAFEDEPLPTRPSDIDTNDDARKAWRRAAHATREKNHLRRIKAVRHTRVMAVAKLVASESAIYFPHKLDFRGRIYPIPDYLSPQGDDLSRALLTFARGKHVGSEGRRWLALHGAGCLKDTPEGANLGKQTEAERLDWIERHSRDICRTAEDPFGATWWVDADKPLQFYAFCGEWSRYMAHIQSGKDPHQFVSGLPIAQDGKCNGLQHFSALLRDEKGAEAVNVIPMRTTDAPQDVYQLIADRVNDKLEAVSATNALAAKWLSSGLVTRKLTKQPTMTFNYGSKKFGFKEQITEYLMGRDDWHKIKAIFTDEEGKQIVSDAAKEMARLIWDSLRETVKPAAEAMTWMQQCARQISASGNPVRWKVPVTNFPVEQGYFESTSEQVRTTLAGTFYKPRVYEQTNTIDANRQINAIAPNIIHSLDAAALMLTVNRAYAEGVESFGMVHDSYSTVAGDCSVLAQSTRMGFFQLHKNDVLASLQEQFSAQMEEPDNCPAPPQTGDLDVAKVFASDYFFD